MQHKALTTSILCTVAVLMVLTGCDLGTSASDSSSNDTLYVYDTTFLVLDTSVHYSNVMYIPVDTNVFYLPATDTGIVLSKIEFKEVESTSSQNTFWLRGTLYNNTGQTLNDLDIIVSIYRLDSTWIGTVSAPVYQPGNPISSSILPGRRAVFKIDYKAIYSSDVSGPDLNRVYVGSVLALKFTQTADAQAIRDGDYFLEVTYKHE